MRSITPLRQFIATLGIVGLLAVIAIAADAPKRQTFELGDKGFEKVKTPDPATPEGQLYLIRKAIAEDRGDDAIDMASDWMDKHPNSPLFAEALLLRGDARTSIHHYFKALYDYEAICRRYPASPQFDKSLEREMQIADAFASGVKRRLWGLRILSAKGEAEELYIRIQERAPGKRIAERAGIALADYYYREAKMSSAADAYELFLKNYPESQWREHAMQRQILANLATFKGPRFDATGLFEAQRRLDDYKRTYPAAAEQIGADAMLTRIDETLATRDLLVAQWYDRRGQKISAGFMYRRLLKQHPGSAAAKKALARLQELEPAAFTEAAREAAAREQAENAGQGKPVPVKPAPAAPHQDKP